MPLRIQSTRQGYCNVGSPAKRLAGLPTLLQGAAVGLRQTADEAIPQGAGDCPPNDQQSGSWLTARTCPPHQLPLPTIRHWIAEILVLADVRGCSVNAGATQTLNLVSKSVGQTTGSVEMPTLFIDRHCRSPRRYCQMPWRRQTIVSCRYGKCSKKQ